MSFMSCFISFEFDSTFQLSFSESSMLGSVDFIPFFAASP